MATVKQSYSRVSKEIESELKKVQSMLKKHKMTFEKSTGTDWGFVGELNRIKQQLKTINEQQKTK